MKMKLAHTVCFSLLLVASSITVAAIQQHTFSISGDNGETGMGSFTWDDAVVADDSLLADFDFPAELLSITIDISGGNVAGGSTSFARGDCTQAILANTPSFVSDINFWCDNGTNSLLGVSDYSSELNGGTSILTFSPGTTAVAVPPPAAQIPTLPVYGLILTILALLMVARRNLPTAITRR